MLTPAERHTMLVGEIIKTPLIVQRLLYGPAKVGQFLRGEESMFWRTLSRAGAAFGAGALAFPGRRNTARQNRTRPPPCMRWRGPCLATLRQVGQLPGLPGLAGRPLVPCTRSRYRFPGSSHVP